MMRVLIYCPLSPTPPRVYDRTWRSIFALHWDGPLDVVLGREDHVQELGNLNLTGKYQKARRMALDGGYDALLTVESDMILPRLALQRMSRVDADVIYGLYVSRHGQHQWLAFRDITDNFKGDNFSKHRELCEASWGQVVETEGIGMGCTLIRRPVLEQIDFRLPDTSVANDWFFALDCRAAGFRQAHDCGVVCGHIDGEQGRRVYWPEPNGGYREEIWHTSP